MTAAVAIGPRVLLTAVGAWPVIAALGAVFGSPVHVISRENFARSGAGLAAATSALLLALYLIPRAPRDKAGNRRGFYQYRDCLAFASLGLILLVGLLGATL